MKQLFDSLLSKLPWRKRTRLRQAQDVATTGIRQARRIVRAACLAIAGLLNE